MSVLLLAALALPGGLATALLAGNRRLAFAVGLVTAAGCALVAASISPEDTVPIAGSVIGGSDGLRTLTVAWAASTFLFGLIDALLGNRADVLGPSLACLGVGAIGLAVADAGVGFALVTAGAIGAAVVPSVVGGPDDRRRSEPGGSARTGGAALAGLGLTSVRSLLASVLLALVAVAWGASPVGPFAAAGPLGEIDPALESGIGVTLLVVVAALVIRLGAIPAHIWAARFVQLMPSSAIPPVLGWGAAAFALVALGWVDVTISPAAAPLVVEHAIVAVVAVASIILGGLAALFRDDVEHILAYAIVQDAGVALLAFASPDGAAGAAAGRDWIVAAVAVKSGLAAWLLVTRSTFGANRRSDLRGWARGAPILAASLVIVLAGAVGLPGMAVFDARATLVGEALPQPISALVLVGSYAPVLFLGRLLVAGAGAPAPSIRDAAHAAIRLTFDPGAGWQHDRSPVHLVRHALRENRYPLAAIASLLAALVGLVLAMRGLG